MDYFKILNLTREPFSNSPEPEFFYQSSQHLGCLQKLELAIRLHRGLNVVMGNVGTGKTTLCRELLIRFAKSEEDRNEVEIHLLLDPAISTPREFLATVATAFGIPDAAAAESEWQLKELIKHHLFQKGVDEKKTVVLIVDEGQKLPDFGLEILREFLNYETNEAKLLQIVIFAQNEFEEILKEHPNFADRVNQFIALEPLNFRETRQLIAYRIAQASGEKPVRLFTWPGLRAVYKATGGYPRRIITLCHQCMLTMIIQNRKRAGWFLVRSCSERVSTEKAAGRRRALIAASALAALLLIAAGILEWGPPLFQESPLSGKAAIAPLEKTAPPVAPAPVAVLPASPPAAPVATPAPPVFNTKKPKVLGRMIVEPGETVYGLLRRVYGAYDEEQLQAFVRTNHRIADINRIRKGDVITLPAVPVRTNPLAPDQSWVAVAMKGSLGEAYESLRSYPQVEGGIRLFPYWNPKEGMVFALLSRSGFPDEKAAGAFIQRLPADFPPGARVIARWSEETEFYAR
ncbi:MAG: AAA family ATPase [Deltaproteobacteria bacterium]|nr:AAA family ATPase [Deltaproteobacteria bacterium]